MLPITVMMTRFPPSLKTLIVVSSLLLFRTECHAAQSDEKAQNLLRREGKNPLLIQHSVPSGAVLLAASAGNYSKKNGDSDEGNPSDIDEESCSAVETHENAEQNNSVAFLLEQSIEGEESDQNERMIMIPACPGQSNIDEPPPSTMFFSSSIGKTAKKFGWLILPLAAVIAILSSSTSDISTTRSSTLFPLKKNPLMSTTSGRDQLHANIGAKYDARIGQHHTRKMDGLFPSDLETALGEGNSIFHKKESEQDFGRIGNGDESWQHQMPFSTNTLQPVNYAQADVKGVETKFLDFGNVGEKEKRYPSGGKDIAVGQQSKNLIEAGSASVDAKKIINVPGTAGSIFVPAAALPTSSSTVSTTIPSEIKHSMIGSKNESLASYDSTTNEHVVTQRGQEDKIHDKADKMASANLNALEDKYSQYTNRQYQRWNGGNCYHCVIVEEHIDQQNNVGRGGSVGRITHNAPATRRRRRQGESSTSSRRRSWWR